MEYQNFLKHLLTYKKIQEDINELYSMGFDFIEGKYQFDNSSFFLFKNTLEAYYHPEGIEWIEWFIFENEWGQKDWTKIPYFDYKINKYILEENPLNAYGAKDENNNPICYSFESTWEFIKQYEK